MALIVGDNSWETVAEADAYLINRIGASNWSLLDNLTKEQYLITSFYWLLYDSSYNLDKTLTDDFIKHAQSESALFLLNYYNEYSKREALVASGVIEFTFSKWQEKLGSLSKPKTVDDIIINNGYSVNTFIQQVNVNYCKD